MKLLVITGAPGVIPFVVPADPPHVPLKFSDPDISKVIVIGGYDETRALEKENKLLELLR